MNCKSVRRKEITLKEKVEVLKRFDELNLSLVRQRDAAAILGITQSTLSKWLKSRHTLNKTLSCPGAASRKRKREGKNPLVGEALFSWFQQESAMNAPINRTVLLQKANDIAKQMNADFVASNGWLTRWKERHGIVKKKVPQPKQDADISSEVEDWITQKWRPILEKYKLENIFNMEETTLYYRATPDRVIASKNAEVSGCKMIKDYITVLLTCNMTGVIKITPLVVIANKSLKFFKGVKNFPTEYDINENARMTSDLFEKYLRKWNLHLQNDGKKIALLLDNSPTHPDLTLSNIELVFIPTSTRALLQSLNQGIVKVWKTLYQTEMRQRIMAEIDDSEQSTEIAEKIGVLDALYMTKDAWDQMSEKCIQNCFAKLNNHTEDDLCADSDEQENISDPGCEEWIKIETSQSISDYAAYEIKAEESNSEVSVNNAEVPMNNIEIPINNAEVRINNIEVPINNTKEVSEADRKSVTQSQALEALSTIKKVIEENGNDLRDFDIFYKLEKTIISYYVDNSTIRNYIRNF